MHIISMKKQKNIKVSYDTWAELSGIRIKKDLRSMGEVVNILLKEYKDSRGDKDDKENQ